MTGGFPSPSCGFPGSLSPAPCAGIGARHTVQPYFLRGIGYDHRVTDPLAVLDAASPNALRLFGYQRQWTATPHGDLHTLTARGFGDLPPLFVVHGLGSSGADYAWAFGPFRRACSSIILPDLYGHGASPSPDVSLGDLKEVQLDALAALVPERAILFGNSLGGVVATQLYARVPERIAAIVLVSPGGAPMDDLELASFLRAFELNDLTAARAFVQRFLGRPGLFAAPYAWGVQQRMSRAPIRRLVERIRSTDLLDAVDISRINCPVLLYWGQQDRVIPAAARDWWFGQLPDAEHMTPEGFGHAPFLDDPRAFARPVVSYLRRVLTAA